MSSEKEFRDRYEILQQKYSLPLFDELDKDFSIILLSKDFTGNILVAVRHRIIDTFQSWINFLHSIYIPSPNHLPSMKQHESMSEEDNKKIYYIISKLSLLTQKSYKISLFWENNDKDADFIKESFGEFKKLRDQIGYFIDKNIKTWETTLKQKT